MEISQVKPDFATSFSRTWLHIIEEKLLAFSGLKLYDELHIFDVPIDFNGPNYIHTTRCGDKNKETLVLLHGYGGSNVLYFPMLKDLTSKYRVYCIDMLGMGLSSRPDFNLQSNPECIDYFVESLEKWRQVVGLDEKFSIGGHSFIVFRFKFR